MYFTRLRADGYLCATDVDGLSQDSDVTNLRMVGHFG